MRLKVPDEVTDEKCELCGRNLVVKTSRFGKFLACPGYPECKCHEAHHREDAGPLPEVRQRDFEAEVEARLRLLRL